MNLSGVSHRKIQILYHPMWFCITKHHPFVRDLDSVRINQNEPNPDDISSFVVNRSKGKGRLHAWLKQGQINSVPQVSKPLPLNGETHKRLVSWNLIGTDCVRSENLRYFTKECEKTWRDHLCLQDDLVWRKKTYLKQYLTPEAR